MTQLCLLIETFQRLLKYYKMLMIEVTHKSCANYNKNSFLLEAINKMFECRKIVDDYYL